MTNREAVDRIKDHMRVHKMGQPPHIKISEALHMAIDALEPAPSTQEIDWLRKLSLSILDGKCKIRVTLSDGASSDAVDSMAVRAVVEYADKETQRYIQRLYEIIDYQRDKLQNAPGSTSDGYHTFDELYRHRGILFTMVCSDHQDIAWKSLKHHDGTMYDDMFICGIDTPYGQATYHMDIKPFWEMMKVTELPIAPEWDGHTPDMALNRIAAMAMDRFIPLEPGIVEA